MGFNCGIVGLPNVGKSTIFNALTNAGAEAANYPFCTIEPNIGIVSVPDLRLDQLVKIFQPKKLTPTTVEFVDIAGLVQGASKGEGLGNQFLGHIRSVDAIAHIVRCFENPDVVHVHGAIDPIRDIEVIQTELILADLAALSQKIPKTQKLAKANDKKAIEELVVYERLEKALNDGKMARSLSFIEKEKPILQDLNLLTQKPTLYVCNVSEGEIRTPSPQVQLVQKRADEEHSDLVMISGSIESELAQMDPNEQKEFLKDYGLTESGLNRLIRQGYHLLDLVTFFTAGPKEVRAWTISKGTKAPQAAGKIHSDFEKGFIRADCYHYNDLVALGSEHKVQEAGKMRLEGKEYAVQDGDILHFRFNV